jgi:hypothetical protein
MNEAKVIENVEALVNKAAKADKSEDAMRFSQAACNAANALRCLTGPKQL